VVRCCNLPGLTLVDGETDLTRPAPMCAPNSVGVVGEVGELKVGILTSLPGHLSLFCVEFIQVTAAETRAPLATVSEREIELLVKRG
jgi:hypothetical protein